MTVDVIGVDSTGRAAARRFACADAAVVVSDQDDAETERPRVS